MLPLSYVFLRTSRRNCKRLLDRIRTRCVHETQLFEVEADNEVWVV